MKMSLLSLFVGALFAYSGEIVEYRDGDALFEGYLSVPKLNQKEKRAAVLICHAWKGIQGHERAIADSLAKRGFFAMALDIYGKGVRPKNAGEAGALSSKYKQDRVLLRKRAITGLQKLVSVNGVDSSKIVAIGYCFGGTAAIELARSGASLVGVASFHGGLDSPNPSDGKNIKSSILILHGADDPMVKRQDINAMLDEFNCADIDWTMVEFSNSVHAFTDSAAGNDSSKGAAYNERAAKDSWRIFLGYLDTWTKQTFH